MTTLASPPSAAAATTGGPSPELRIPPFQPFELERDLSRYEYAVDYNLSESGVHPLDVKELYEEDPAAFDRLREVSLYYAPGAGLPALREAIASTYQRAAAENVMVAVGAIEANFAALTTVTRPGDEVVVMSPNYQQVHGVATNYGLDVKEFPLLPDRGFAPDLDVLREQVTDCTKRSPSATPTTPRAER